MKYTIKHSDWGDELYGWQVLCDGKVIDTYEDKIMAITYTEFMNDRVETKANDLGELRAWLHNEEKVQ